MDPPVKAGPLLLQQPPGLRLGAKRWKKSWFVLYPASPHGVARLEFFDCKEGTATADRLTTKRQDKKILRLADCVSVAPAPDCGPKDGLAAFRLETSERAYLFAAEPHETAEWVAQLCKAAFLNSPGQGAQPDTQCGEQEQALEMATNAIYYSREEVSTFWVTVQKTEAAERCHLQGTYVLKASCNSLVLEDPHSKQPLYTWPYRLLRRYGRDKVMFSFEAGRRCESGPGNFTFETRQGNEIFQVVEVAIRTQKAQAEENRQSSSSLDSEAAGLAQIQSTIASILSLESEGPAPERQGPRVAPPAQLSLAAEEKEVVVSPLKGQQQKLRDPLARWPSTPLHCPLPEVPSEVMGSVYSEPLDAVKGSRARLDPLYADPVDSRLCAAVDKEKGWHKSASLVYEQVGPSGAGACQELPGGSGGMHIYDEPEGRAPQPAPLPVAIYDEACLPCEAWRTKGLPSDGDCAVATTPQKRGQKLPKPCPVPKPPRTHKKASPPHGRGQAGLHQSSSSPSTTPHHPAGAEPLYSRVLKLSNTPAGPGSAGQEESVDESRPTSVYEDLGEI
ncbi:docking protein 1 isoform X2 [Tiliqua scincoides]|uniref:docking protein 1 isoform X2 n=1 Tax=Tiliqua scincoides TaxID=71010 RepID=UPI00346315E9